jgi:hypothetical protein
LLSFVGARQVGSKNFHGFPSLLPRRALTSASGFWQMGSQAASTYHMQSFGSRSAVSLSDFGSALCAVQQFLLRCMRSFRSL